MKDQILNLADDLFLEDNSPKRNAFVLEFESAVELMRENDWDQFYAFADIIMQKYSQGTWFPTSVVMWKQFPMRERVQERYSYEREKLGWYVETSSSGMC